MARHLQSALTVGDVSDMEKKKRNLAELISRWWICGTTIDIGVSWLKSAAFIFRHANITG